MAYIINVPDNDWSSQVVILGKSRYRLELKFKERLNRWYFSLFDNDGERLVTERKIIPGVFLTEPFSFEGFEGALICEVQFGADEYPSRDNLGRGKAFELQYLTAEEMRLLADLFNEVV
ncbi:phage baseplate plug family protein [Buttiauxella noackiae]|uniref:phage baseplate plug family protein n=1 Tax=Buttiauxella noackiae TaxID=82992 RepID=UPI00054D1911|nr:hypothetical protein [Buttiauxella noackiae]